MRLIFMGTPEFAVPSLEALPAAGHRVLAVYTQPDRPKGRGQSLEAPPVKQAAMKLGLEIRQPLKIRDQATLDQLRADSPDAIIVVGYGKIIPQSIIDLPRCGIVNVHASLLPKYRGAAPIQWAIAEGETVTGVTTMQIDAGLDTGDMLMKRELAIGPEETAIELGPRLATLGAELLIETLARLEAGKIQRVPQDHASATLAPILERDHGRVDWQWPASVIHNRARGFQPWPGAWTIFRGQRFNVWRCRVANTDSLGPDNAQPKLDNGGAAASTPGSLAVEGRRLYVQCGSGTRLELLEVQMEGRKRVDAAAFVNGQRLAPNETLGDS